MKKLSVFLALGAIALTLHSADVIKWNGANNFSGWNRTRNCTKKIENGVLILDVTGKDHQLSNDKVKLHTADYGALEVDYRIRGVPAKNSGQLYFDNGKGMTDKQVVIIKNLEVGRKDWTTLQLNFDGKNVRGWQGFGNVSRLRLDMVDQAPGKIEIKEIRLVPKHLVKPVDAGIVGKNAEQPEIVKWNHTNNFKGWTHPVKCDMYMQDDYLVLDITGPDSSIRNLSANIPADKYDAMEVDYRMTGIPAVNNGELYFTPAGGNFSEKRVWRFQNLKPDADWQTLRVSLADNNREAWVSCGKVMNLRLDLVNQYPGKIEIREIRFMPNLPELDDSRAIRYARKMMPVKSMIPDKKLPEILDLGRPYYTGYMLRSKDDVAVKLPAKGARFAFRREFDISCLPVKARLHIGADDAYTSKLNGQHLSSSGTWYEPHILDLAPERFNIGKNVLTGIYWNHGGPGGVYWELELLFPDNSIKKIASDSKTVMTPTGKGDWSYPAENAVWTPAVLQTMSPEIPWRITLPFKPLEPVGLALKKNEFPAEVESGKTYFWNVGYSGVKCEKEQNVTFIMENHNGLELYKKVFPVSEVQTGEGQFRIPVAMPKFLPSGKRVLKLCSSQVILPETKKEVFYKNIRKKGPDYQARVRNGNVYLNGKQCLPFLGHSQGTHNYKEAGYHRAGVQLRSFVASIYQKDRWWRGPGEYDFSTVDCRIESILSLDENAGIVIYLPTTPPRWWGKLYPDEVARRSDGSMIFDHEAKVSFSSEQYRRDAGDAIEAFIRHVQSAPYSDRIAGYTILGGTTYEWLRWEPFEKVRFSDYSKPAQRAFAEYLAKYAPEMDARIPTSEERKAAEFGLFIDPEKNLRTLLYTRYFSESIAECLETFIKRARKAAGENKLIGIYYGYAVAGGNQGKTVGGSHSALKRVLEIDELDFLLCPMSYMLRNLGDCGESGQPFAGIRAAGKMPIVEDDMRTYLQGIYQPYYQTPDAWTTEQQIRRSMGRTISRNEMAEFYALTTGKEFSSDAVQNDIKTFRKTLQFIVDDQVKAQPEIAVVYSAGAYDYLAEGTPRILTWHWEFDYNNKAKPHFVPHTNTALIGDLWGYQRTNLAKIGAPVDYLLAEDLGRVADRPYKLWIFLNQFNTTPEFDAALKKIRSRKNTCLFMYAPGVFRNDKIDFANMERITGIKLQKKSGSGLARVSFPENKVPETRYLRYRGMGNENSLPLLFEALSGKTLAVYPDGKAGVAMTQNGGSKTIFCGVPKLAPSFVRSLAADAGVWIFSHNEDILFANDSFVTLHAVEAGKKVIKFPRLVDVVDVFSGEILARGVKEYSFEAKMYETKVFYYGNRAEKFRQAVGKK